MLKRLLSCNQLANVNDAVFISAISQSLREMLLASYLLSWEVNS